MSLYLADSADLTSVANAIRTKGGTSAQLAFPAGFVSAIQAIETGAAPVSVSFSQFTDATAYYIADDGTFASTPISAAGETITTLAGGLIAVLHNGDFEEEIALTRINGYVTSTGTIWGSTTTYFHSFVPAVAGEVYRLSTYDASTAVIILGAYDENNAFSIVRRGGGTSNQVNAAYTVAKDGRIEVSGLGTSWSYTHLYKQQSIVSGATLALNIDLGAGASYAKCTLYVANS